MSTITVHGKTYKLPENPVWHEGPPPAIGWWPACKKGYIFEIECLRFFNGVAWSVLCYPNEIGFHAGRQAENNPDVWTIEEVKWTTQWWKGQQ